MVTRSPTADPIPSERGKRPLMELPTIDAVRDYVRRVLCERADVEADVPMIESILYRAGGACGMSFMLWATRTTRLSAVWETVENRILFYDHTATRFFVAGVRGPDIATLAGRTSPSVNLRSTFKAK